MANELILIVEDNPKNLKLVRDTLQVKGHRTIEPGTREEAVRLARVQQPPPISMDIQLPKISEAGLPSGVKTTCITGSSTDTRSMSLTSSP